MDYGQTKQSTDSQAFFTAGVGNIPAEENTYKPENNLDLTNDATSWVNRDTRNIGSKAIFSSEVLTDSPEITNPDKNVDSPKESLQEIIDVVAPPTADFNQETTVKLPAFDSKAIRTDGDHINKKAISEVDHVISELAQTGNAADFYATVRGDDAHPGMVRDNLKNSYNREVA